MSDHMNEAERLLSEYGDAVSDVVLFAQDPAGYSRRVEATRAALLAHIQRGAVPDMYDRIAEAHDASIDEDQTGCRAILKECMRLLAAAPAPDQFRDAAKMVPAPAEVPMPEPVARILEWRGRLALSPQPSARTFDEFPTSETFPAKKDAYWSDGKLLVLADEARTYGDTRAAAGYARCLREMLDCRTCRNYTRDGCIQTAQCVDGDGYRRATPVRFWSAALRGEVK